MKQTITFIRRAVLALLMIMLTATTAWAGQVTEEQARQQAQNFLTNIGPTSGTRRASATTPQFTSTSQVSGLYVFNVDGGGFVIVSNDDRTIPVLGYSDTGSIDPDNMPDNMRAWLQGYADEIAWVKQHNIPQGTRTSASRRAGGHSTAAIPPLLTTKWDQNAPYNNLCPTIERELLDEKEVIKCVTGCMATAMAQVMNYHQWPKKVTKAIPGYIVSEYSLELKDLPATTFDWANMKDNYSANNYTPDEANAVATLMQYCGYSIQMEYGPESASFTAKVADALRDYFDYNTTTTQYVSRNYYTAEKWADLIYRELANKRPVVYSGYGNYNSREKVFGHAFVCDGYKYENGTDFFHINWGWSGKDDDYFVLSALFYNETAPEIDPEANAGKESYRYGQDAVIGIQPSTTGPIVDVTPSTAGPRLNSMTLSSNRVVGGVPVNITLNVTNDSPDDYDGDLYIGWKDGDNYKLLVGDSFRFAAGETKDVVIPFTPTTLGTYNLVFCLPNATGSYSTDGQVHATLNIVVPNGLTVYDGAENSRYVPACISSFNRFTRSQFVIPAPKLEAMKDGDINSISFYAINRDIPYITDCTVDVYVKEVDYTTIEGFEEKESSSVVYQGRLNVIKTSDGGLLTIPFNTPYTYNGGNLLIGIENTTNGDLTGVAFYGQTVNKGAVYGTNEVSLANVDPYSWDFIPKTTFEYTASSDIAYHKPKGIAASKVTAESATLSWTAPIGDVTGYAWQYKKADEETWSPEATVTTTTVTISGLTAATAYHFRVKALYGGNESDAAVTNFNTGFSEDMCSITLKLTDRNGDGWNGAAIRVVDAQSGIVIGTYTNKDLDGIKGIETNTLLVPVPNDRDINFLWKRGRLDNECSFIILDVNGKEIYTYAMQDTGKTLPEGKFKTYHVDCRYTPNPSDLTVTAAPTTATATWTGVAGSYDIRYAPLPGTGFGAGWLQYDDGTNLGGYGNSTPATWTWGVMYPAVTGNRLTKVSFHENINMYIENPVTVSIYAGNDAPSGTPLRQVEVIPTGNTSFREVTFDKPVEITPKENVWIVLSLTGTTVMSVCNSSEPNNQWIYDGGSWKHLGDMDASCANYGWMIRGYFESTTDMETFKWTEATATSGSYPITGLTPETDYIIQVRGDYGSDGKSDWVNSLFTTPAVNTSVSLVTDPSTKGKGCIYTLDGVKLDKMPTRKGVYIQNKRKVVVK